MDAAQRMDQQYRYQRYVYDFSRKYYLLGRDTLLQEMGMQAGDKVLELGCGTGRNLLRMAYRSPRSKFYGVDASALMLEMAEEKIIGTLYSRTIFLKQGLAEQVGLEEFGLRQGFDHIVFSYVLSMIPGWEAALENALKLLRPGGQLHVVDFSDQAGMPGWFRRLLLQWLDWFHVHPEPRILEYLQQMAAREGDNLEMRHLAGRYAMLAHYHKWQESEKEQSPFSRYLEF